MEISTEDASGILTYDHPLIFTVFVTSFVAAFAVTILGFIVFYLCNKRRLRSDRTIMANPTYIALDPLKYSHIFAEDTSDDVSISTSYVM